MPEIMQSPVMIVGPCAVESREQVISATISLLERNVFIERGGLYKPRTSPGFDGLGLQAAPWVAEATRMGITFGTEVMLPEHVDGLLEAVNQNGGDPSKLFFWLGSRNQNHMIQSEVGRRINQEAKPSVRLMIKNQPWGDEAHWLGIVDHVVDAGLSSERIDLCHRGFSPYGRNNPDGFRNPPDFEMAMRIKEKTRMPMIVDLSHIAGSVDGVFEVARRAIPYGFDGYMVEFHPNPSDAQTDKRQQLDLNQLDKLISIVSI